MPRIKIISIPQQFRNGGELSSEKAKIMLHEGIANGHKITDKQRRYFGYLAGKGKSEGGEIVGAGGPKEDKIKAEVKAGSFIVPAANAHKAKEIRKKFLSGSPRPDEIEPDDSTGAYISDGTKIMGQERDFTKINDRFTRLAANKKANLKQKGGEYVRLSNGEHMFTPEEVEHLEKNGVDLDELAPDSEDGKYGKQKGGTIHIDESKKGTFTAAATKHGMSVQEFASHVLSNKEDYSPAMIKKANFAHNAKGFKHKEDGGEIEGYAEGGEVPKKDIIQGINMKQSELESIDEQIKNIEEGSNELDKQLKLPRLKKQREIAAKNVEYAKDPKNYSDLGKGLGYGFTPPPETSTSNIIPSLQIPKTTIPKSTKSTVAGGVSGVGRINKTTPAIVDKTQIDTIPAKSYSTKITPDISQPIENIPESPGLSNDVAPSALDQLSAKINGTGIGKYLSNNTPNLAGVAGLGLAGLQGYLGYKQLKKDGTRPVDAGTIDPEFTAAIEQAKNDAKYGISPEERNIAERGIQTQRAADVANILNASGGSGGTALANIRAAGNQAQNNLGNLSAESERLRLEKQRYANSLLGQKAMMARNIQRQQFEDKLNAFNVNQQAGANLLGAGIQNAVGALRYNREARRADELSKTGQGGGYTGITKSTKKDYLSAAGGDEAKARQLATQYGENYDSLY